MLLRGDCFPRVAIAVSGGSDSIALLILANEWAKSCGAQIIVLTVDHQMRDDSFSDCLFVKDLATRLGIGSYILSWKHENITSNLQARARKARYLLLTNFCKELGIVYLCLGHHSDDVVENFFLMLMRGSGIFGLSMKDVTFVNNVMILRPLLSFKKTDCITLLRDRKIEWREDSSNQNHKFTRNKVRSQLTDLHVAEGVISTQSHLDKIADSVVRNAFLEIIANCVFISEFGYSVIDIDLINNACEELQYLVIAHALTIIRGIDRSPSFKSVKLLWNKIKTEKVVSTNLHGCVVIKQGLQAFIMRSFGKEDVPSVRLTDYVLWDKRFSVELLLPKDYLGVPYLVDRLRSRDFELFGILYNLSNFSNIDLTRSKFLYRKFLESLLVIRNESGAIVGVPHACYYSEEGRILHNAVRVRFTPCFISRLVHFF